MSTKNKSTKKSHEESETHQTEYTTVSLPADLVKDLKLYRNIYTLFLSVDEKETPKIPLGTMLRYWMGHVGDFDPEFHDAFMTCKIFRSGESRKKEECVEDFITEHIKEAKGETDMSQLPSFEMFEDLHEQSLTDIILDPNSSDELKSIIAEELEKIGYEFYNENQSINDDKSNNDFTTEESTINDIGWDQV